jgi:glycosyltransferase involved in cell wall biosynthesis
VTRRTVAVVTPFYPPRVGGVERYAERIASELRDSPDLRPVVIPSAPGRRGEVQIRDGVEVVRLPRLVTVSNTPMNPLWLLQLHRVLRRHRVELVNTHAPVPFLADLAALVAGRRPLVATYHSGSMVKHSGALDPLIRLYEAHLLTRTFRRADNVVAVSRTALGHDVPGARVITPGVDTDTFTPAGQPCGTTLLYVGRIERASAWKGIDVLLRAFALVVAQEPRARLRLVGSGDAVEDQRALARSLGIADRVEFTGTLAMKDLVGAYQHARALVLPSLTESESFGMTLVEAMACGRPVVGSDIGGIPTVVDDGDTGLLVPPGDVSALARACLRVLGDDELCAHLGAAGRRRAETTYAWPALTDDYLTLFRSLLGPERPPSPGARRTAGAGQEPQLG